MPEKVIESKLLVPQVIWGTSSLGNLFVAQPYEVKCEIIHECILNAPGKIIFDSAGKYGAGLALETLGKCLHDLKVDPSNVSISNKLGWLRTELKTAEPTFEPGVWKDLQYDAIQKISYDGILECFEQGNELLQGYIPQMVSIHDPDEYLARAEDEEEEKKLYNDIREAYKALFDLKKQGKVGAVGVGAKNWKAIYRIAQDIQLDWVMIANSMTIKTHPADLLQFMRKLESKNITIINSAVFHSGFLIGGDFFDYKEVKRENPQHAALFQWRDAFFKLCEEFSIKPAEAAVQFALKMPGVKSIALNTTSAKRVKSNYDMMNIEIPDAFWQAMKQKKLLEPDFNI